MPETAPPASVASPTENTPAAPPAAEPVVVAPTPPSDALVEAKHIQQWLGKPPLAIQYLDVTVQNPSDEIRWILLPETFPYKDRTDPYPGDGELAELQIFELSKKPRVVIANGVGSHFWASKLPGKAKLSISRLPIDSWWEKTPPSVKLEAIVAREVTVDGKKLETCFESDPLSEGGSVKAPRDAGDPRAQKFWHPRGEGYRSAKVVIDVESKSSLTVQLGN